LPASLSGERDDPARLLAFLDGEGESLAHRTSREP
jgi:hypothetical protein